MMQVAKNRCIGFDDETIDSLSETIATWLDDEPADLSIVSVSFTVTPCKDRNTGRRYFKHSALIFYTVREEIPEMIE